MMSERFIPSGRFPSMTIRPQFLCCCLVAWGLLWLARCGGHPAVSVREDASFQRTRVFLAAADYRRAIKESQRNTMERPSALSYVVLTYVYQALDSYVESLAKADRWVEVELLAASLGAGRPEDLLDSPDILTRIAKELIQASARKQSVFRRPWRRGLMNERWPGSGRNCRRGGTIMRTVGGWGCRKSGDGKDII